MRIYKNFYSEFCRINKHFKVAFTLAETLITLVTIGVVAALAMPSFLISIQDILYNERAKNTFYKLSQATDKMKALGLLETKYESTSAFVDELEKHLKISKRCSSENIVECFGNSKTVNFWGQSIYIDDLKTSSGLGKSKWNSLTEGIVLADGTPILLTYNVAKCQPMSEWEQTSHSENGTSNTLNCLSIVFDTNQNKPPNKISKDIRALNNALDKYKIGNDNMYIDTPRLPSRSYTYDECKNIGLTQCCTVDYCNNTDYWLGGFMDCYENDGRLINDSDFAKIAKVLYGPDTSIPAQFVSSNSVSIQDDNLFLSLTSGKNSDVVWGIRNLNTERVFIIQRNSFMLNSNVKYDGTRKFVCIYD